MFFDVLAEQVFSIVVAVRRSQDRMNMVTGRSGRTKRGDTPLVVEFNEQNGAVNPIIEDVIRISPSYP